MTINRISKQKHALYVIALAVFLLANTETIKAAGTQESIYSDLPVYKGNALELWDRAVSIAEVNDNWLAEFTYITMEATLGEKKVKESKRTIHTTIDNDGNIINETIEDTNQGNGEDDPHKSGEDMEKMKEMLDRMNDNGGLLFLFQDGTLKNIKFSSEFRKVDFNEYTCVVYEFKSIDTSGNEISGCVLLDQKSGALIKSQTYLPYSKNKYLNVETVFDFEDGEFWYPAMTVFTGSTKYLVWNINFKQTRTLDKYRRVEIQ